MPTMDTPTPPVSPDDYETGRKAFAAIALSAILGELVRQELLSAAVSVPPSPKPSQGAVERGAGG